MDGGIALFQISVRLISLVVGGGRFLVTLFQMCFTTELCIVGLVDEYLGM